MSKTRYIIIACLIIDGALLLVWGSVVALLSGAGAGLGLVFYPLFRVRDVLWSWLMVDFSGWCGCWAACSRTWLNNDGGVTSNSLGFWILDAIILDLDKCVSTAWLTERLRQKSLALFLEELSIRICQLDALLIALGITLFASKPTNHRLADALSIVKLILILLKIL